MTPLMTPVSVRVCVSMCVKDQWAISEFVLPLYIIHRLRLSQFIQRLNWHYDFDLWRKLQKLKPNQLTDACTVTWQEAHLNTIICVYIEPWREGVGGILVSCIEHSTHTHTHTERDTHVHRNQESVLHWQGLMLPCARWSHLPLPWRHQPEGKALLCVRMRVCVCVCLWLWQKLELEEEKEEEEEEKEKEGLQEFTLCLACLRFMPHSLTTLYQGEYWTGPFNYQGNKFSMAVSLK